jgi:hypothetical protein
VSEPDDLPRLPNDRIEPSPRKLSEVKPGERVVLSVISNITVDEEGHIWVDTSSRVSPGMPLVPGLSLRAERTEKGFIVWLDKSVKFRRGRLYHRHYLPVVEFREAPQREE